MANYAFTAGNPLPDGTVFEMCNFTQAVPHTSIFVGRTGLKFVKCNLMNCDLPPDAIVEGGLHCHVSFCSHEHPKWIAKGLPECAENCQHLVDTDEITIDGVVLDIVRIYKDKGVA